MRNRRTQHSRITAASLVGIVLAALTVLPVRAYQAAPGSICVSAFVDTNQNGLQESGEPLLSGANISLAEGGLIIANHLTDSQGQYCFQNLAPGAYTLTFSDPLAQP